MEKKSNQLCYFEGNPPPKKTPEIPFASARETFIGVSWLKAGSFPLEPMKKRLVGVDENDWLGVENWELFFVLGEVFLKGTEGLPPNWED